ncbi:MAG TPA: uroporphyrinogen-III C-methyltransferase [Gallionella sp.]|nr:uroporphyrinogen-III C-methyltransferase [Gallionella sp.]
MNEPTPAQETIAPISVAPDGAISPPRQRTSVADLFARISVTQMTLAVLVAIFLWQWFAGHLAISDMRREIAEKIAEMDGTSKANQIMLERSQDQVRELSAKVATLESHYAESQNQRAALETLYNDLSISRDETALAEVEQMLLIAGQQLQLSANVKAALIAMQSADARLQRMDRPAFNGLRKAIGQDMVKLRALPNVDVAGINDQLNELMGGVDGLPLIYQQRVARTAHEQPAAPNETAWQGLVREIWQDIRQLVRIENTGKVEIPLLPPEQEFFLRENLKMRFQAARLALLSRDEVAFRQELKTAQFWTVRYFDTGAGAGMKMLAGVKRLASASINIELPDISPSLQAVRSYRLTRDGAGDRGLQSKAAR